MLNFNPDESESSSGMYRTAVSSRVPEEQSTSDSHPSPPGAPEAGMDQMDPNHFLQMYGVLDNHCNICDELTELFDTLDSDHQLGFLLSQQQQQPPAPEPPRPQTVSVGVQTSAPKPCRGHGRTLLEQLQQNIPHLQELGANDKMLKFEYNHNHEKLSQARLLKESSEFLKNQRQENMAQKESVELLKREVRKLHAEISGYQKQLPNYVANRDSILEKQKSVPNLFNQHKIASSKHDLKYSLFGYLMDPFVKLFEEKVSQINSADMEKTSTKWVEEKMSISEMRTNIYQRLVTLSTDTNILEDPANTCLEILKQCEKKQEGMVPFDNKAFLTKQKASHEEEPKIVTLTNFVQQKTKKEGGVVFSISSHAHTSPGDSRHRKIHKGVIFQHSSTNMWSGGSSTASKYP